MLEFLRMLRAPTIWAPGAIPEDERKYAVPLKRVALPVYDGMAIVAGFYAMRSGIPSFEALVPAVAVTLSLVFTGVALLCLVGIVLPKAAAVEIAAKCALIAILGMYFLALRIRAVTDEAQVDFISMAVLLSLVLPLYRLWILGDEAGDRRAKRRGSRHKRVRA
jgi:hypothetical protein